MNWDDYRLQGIVILESRRRQYLRYVLDLMGERHARTDPRKWLWTIGGRMAAADNARQSPATTQMFVNNICVKIIATQKPVWRVIVGKYFLQRLIDEVPLGG